MAASKEQSKQSLLKFANDLYAECAAKGGNVVMSPFSIASALTLLSQGARGATFDEIKNGLHLSGNKEAIAGEFNAWQHELKESLDVSTQDTFCLVLPFTLTVANKIYVKSGFDLKREFIWSAKNKFYSELELLNFDDKSAAAAKINTWVAKKTENRITNIITSNDFNEPTRLVLLNAVYSRAGWKHRFQSIDTKVEPFWTSEIESIEVNMMHKTSHFLYGAIDALDATALEMGYENSKPSFLVLLPNQRTGLRELEMKLKCVNLADLMKCMRRELVSVALPKFRVEYEVNLEQPLKKMGISKIFHANNADLRDMLTNGDPELHVSGIVHKAFINVNETGTDANGAYLVQPQVPYDPASAPTVPIDFTANHPFVYIIKANDKYDSPLFFGSLRSPTPAIGAKTE